MKCSLLKLYISLFVLLLKEHSNRNDNDYDFCTRPSKLVVVLAGFMSDVSDIEHDIQGI